MTKPKTRAMQRQRRAQPPKSFIETHATKLITLAGVISAVAVIMSYSRLIIDSHLPTASQSDLQIVDQQLAKTKLELIDQLEKLDTRQQQSIARGQSVADQLRNLRMSALRTEIKLLESARDAASISLVARDEQELEDLMRQSSVPAPLPK